MECGFLHWGHDISPEENQYQAGLAFTIRSKKDVDFIGKKALEKFVNSKKYNLAFKLYPTNISQVLSFAEKKKYMPQKSTWFHPKPLDGLISSKIIS